MAKPAFSLLPPALRAKIVAHLPAPARQYWTGLTPARRQIIGFSALGVIVFLLVWLIVASLYEPSLAIVSARDLQIPSYNQGTLTAITKDKKNFPEQAGGVQPAAPVAAPDILDTLHLTPSQKSQLLELRQNVDSYYKSTLSFTINEAKMIAFAQAATKIDMINGKWDTLIAGAATEDLATEYLTSATLESRQLLTQSVGITAGEYDDVYALSTRDPAFNKIANAYKDLVSQGIWGPITPVNATQTVSVDPALRFPVVKAATSSPLAFPVAPTSAVAPGQPNSAAPAAGGIAPTPLDSPALPYLQQQGR